MRTKSHTIKITSGSGRFLHDPTFYVQVQPWSHERTKDRYWPAKRAAVRRHGYATTQPRFKCMMAYRSLGSASLESQPFRKQLYRPLAERHRALCPSGITLTSRLPPPGPDLRAMKTGAFALKMYRTNPKTFRLLDTATTARLMRVRVASLVMEQETRIHSRARYARRLAQSKLPYTRLLTARRMSVWSFKQTALSG